MCRLRNFSINICRIQLDDIHPHAWFSDGVCARVCAYVCEYVCMCVCVRVRAPLFMCDSVCAWLAFELLVAQATPTGWPRPIRCHIIRCRIWRCRIFQGLFQRSTTQLFHRRDHSSQWDRSPRLRVSFFLKMGLAISGSFRKWALQLEVPAANKPYN